METVTISARFHVAIPKGIREQLKLAPGQKLQALAFGDRIELIPFRTARDLRGFAKGLDTKVLRDKDRL